MISRAPLILFHNSSPNNSDIAMLEYFRGIKKKNYLVIQLIQVVKLRLFIKHILLLNLDLNIDPTCLYSRH